MLRLPRPALLVPSLATALVLAGCGGPSAADDSGSAADAGGAAAGGAAAATDGADGGGLAVVAAFYPLEFLVAGVGGDRVDVTSLTPPGAEPHDLELSPQALAALTDADLLVVLGDFQPAVDDAVAQASAPVLDIAEVADRPYDASADEHAHAEAEHADDEHADDEHAEDEHAEDEHAHGDTDPHFWTDPTHMVEAAGLVEQALTEADPDGAEVYAANADELVAELTALDEEAQSALGSCAIDTLVTAHAAFGYFGDRYGFDVRSINGLSPEQGPDARTLAEISDFVADSSVTTVYTETLVPTDVADTVAAEAGAQTAVLDPVEGLTDESAGADYLEVMRANIDTVRDGQSCA